MRLGPLAAYAAAAVVYASPLASRAAVADGSRFERAGGSFSNAIAPPTASASNRSLRAATELDQPRSLLEAMIIQMGGTARPSGRGIFIDLRV